MKKKRFWTSRIENEEEKSFIIKYYSNRCEGTIMTRSDNILNMQITIANTMKQEWNIDFGKDSMQRLWKVM